MVEQDPHAYERHYEYKTNPPRLVELRPIPSHHFVQKIVGDGATVSFLPRVSVDFEKMSEDDHIYVKNTCVGNLFNGSRRCDYRQLTQCFDVSCRPIGQTRKTPMQIGLKLDSAEISDLERNCQTIVLLTFDNNTRVWKEIVPHNNENGTFDTKVQFYGKFVFCTKPKIDQFLLTEVATSHKILNTASSSCKISIEDDVIDKFGAVLSLTRRIVDTTDLARIQGSIGLKNIKVGQVFNFDIQGNLRTKVKDLVRVTYATEAESSDTTIVVAMKKVGSDGMWKVLEGPCHVAMGNTQVMFVETDHGNAQDHQKMTFFATELEYVLNSSKTNIYVYQHADEANRMHIGFCEKSDPSWTLLGKNEGIILREQASVSYQVTDGVALVEDNGPKQLQFFAKNRTGIDFFVIAKPGATKVSIGVGVCDSVTKELGTVLDCTVETNDSFKPYIQEKIYEHVEIPEIFREYKLSYLKNLSPLEREKYKHINGM